VPHWVLRGVPCHSKIKWQRQKNTFSKKTIHDCRQSRFTPAQNAAHHNPPTHKADYPSHTHTHGPAEDTSR
jgi:hypothetical protein